MKFLPVVSLFLLSWSGTTFADQDGPVVVVGEGNDAILPCTLSTKENIELKAFTWITDGQKQVFSYDAGIHSIDSPTGQVEQFKGRVSYFPGELKNGDASIKITNTMLAESGNYSCVFAHLQSETRHIQLVVRGILKDRSEENIPGAAPEPSVTILDQTKDWALLQCKVRGASPKPKVEWKDRSGNIVPAEKPQVSKRGDIILQATVTKTDNYSCVATQEKIYHQTHAEIYVFISGPLVVKVVEGSDVILPCSLSTEENITMEVFDWKKDGLEVFFYNRSSHYNKGRSSQSEQFKGRVSHFPDELKYGDASIKITKTKVADSGYYTCIFPHLQPERGFNIQLVVESTEYSTGLIVGVSVLGVGFLVLLVYLFYNKLKKGSSVL